MFLLFVRELWKKTQNDLKPIAKKWLHLTVPLNCYSRGGLADQTREEKKTFKSLKPIFRMKRLLSKGLFKEHLDTFDKAPRHSRGIRGDGKGQDQTLNKSDIA